jgi:hypothetical protein
MMAMQTMLYTWNDYYWASNVLLAELTDGGTFHQQTQYFLQQWICGFNSLVQYTGKGRAWNTNDGTMATTANAVFLATRYAAYVQYSNEKKSAKYLCWARAQVRLCVLPSVIMHSVWMHNMHYFGVPLYDKDQRHHHAHINSVKCNYLTVVELLGPP